MALEPARIFIERMKVALGVRTDEELSRKLGYSKQAVANWRKRDTIPTDISEKMSDAFGPEFAANEDQKHLLEMRESEVVHAVALFAYERCLKDIGRDQTPHDRRSFGYLFPSLIRAVRTALRNVGFEQENSLSMIELLTALVARKALPEVEEILVRAPTKADDGVAQ